MKTYETVNGIYDIYSDFDVEEGKNISDYAYYQLDTKLLTALGGSRSFCSGVALAQCLMLYHNDKGIIPYDYVDEFNTGNFNWGYAKDVDTDVENKKDRVGKFYDGKTEFDNSTYIDTYASTIVGTKQLDNYVDEIADSLKVERPVIICVYHYETKKNDQTGEIEFYKDSTHFVTVVGVKSGVDLDNAELSDFVIFDPGTNKGKQLTTMDNTYTDYNYYPYNYRIITPYLYDSDNKDYIRDENKKKTTDSYYVDPVIKSDQTIIPSDPGRTIKDIIKSINNTSLPDHEKERIIAQMIKTFTGETDVYINLEITENGEYEPEEGVTAFDKVVVDVKANVRSKGITENGEYRAANDGVEGFNVVNVNVPGYGEGYLKGFSDAADKIREVEELEEGGGEPVDVPEDDDRGGGTYHFADGAVKGLSEDNAGYIARQFKDGGYITDIVHGKIIKFGVEYDEQRSYEEWHLILELYDARTGELIQSASSYWADCRNWTGSNGNDELKISNVSAFSGFYMGISVYWYKYNAPSGYTRDSGKYVRWVNDNVKPQYVVSKTMPTYTAGE